MNHFKSVSAATLALVFFAACGSMGGLDDVLGGGSSPRTDRYEIRGTVESVDTNSRSVVLTNVSGYQTMLSSGNAVRVYYDDRTPVEWQGQTYRPSDLERGDEVVVRVDESGNRLVAERMTVTRNVSAGGMTSSSTNPGTIRGTVRFVDTSRRTIELETSSMSSYFNPGSTSGNIVVVHYDHNTGVEFGGRMHPVQNLERGDVVEVQVQDTRGGLFAQRIFLVRDVRR